MPPSGTAELNAAAHSPFAGRDSPTKDRYRGDGARVSLPVVHAGKESQKCFTVSFLRALHANLNGVNETIADGWRERQACIHAALVAQFSAINLFEFFGVPGENTRAPPRSFAHPLQKLISLFETAAQFAWDLARDVFLLPGEWRTSQPAPSRRSPNIRTSPIRSRRTASAESFEEEVSRPVVSRTIDFFSRSVCKALKDLQTHWWTGFSKP